MNVVQQGQHELVVAPLRAESAQVLAGLVLIVWKCGTSVAIELSCLAMLCAACCCALYEASICCW